MKTLPLLCALAVLTGHATAKEKVTFDDLLLEDGTTLKQASVLKVEPDGLRIEHSNGVSKVKYEDLPASVQKQFSFDRDEAAKFRDAQDAAREERLDAERKARVEQILDQRREEQESDLQRAREAFFKLLESDEYSYPQMEKSLIDSIAIFKEAGRKDLAALLEDDRKLLREREVARPGEKYRREREQLQARIQMLENQLVAQGVQPPLIQDPAILPIFVDRTVIVDRPVIVDPNVPCPPGKVIPPRGNPGPSRPGSPATNPPGPRPAQPPYTPAPQPAVSPRPSLPSAPAHPSVPSTPVVLPSSGAQVQGAHLWDRK